jgi:hypothetical protein
MRFNLFAVAEFGALGGHATAFLRFGQASCWKWK